MAYPQSSPKRGEVYWVDFGVPQGSEQAGRRPAAVISLDSFNSHMPVVVVAAITSKIKPFNRIVVDLPAGKPLSRAGQILAFQVRTIDQTRLDKYAGVLDAQQVSELETALRFAWGL